MALLSLHNVSIAFGGPPLLENVTLDIQRGQRICLLGRNGAGKSTFLKITAGILAPDSGDVIMSPGLQAAYLPQTVPELQSGTAIEAVLRGGGQKGEKLLEWFQTPKTDLDKMQKLHDYLDLHRGWELEAVARRVLQQTGIDPLVQVSTLSGGMRRRVYLARALVKEPDLLLLDEPTNHMDIESIRWLESFILGTRLTVFFVTHDRKLLRRLSNRILELDRGSLADWSCDYETFLERKQATLMAEEKQWDRFDKALAEEEKWIRQGIKARRTRNEGRVRTLLKMREERKKRRTRSSDVKMQISEAGRSGEKVLEAKDVSFSYGDNQVVGSFGTVIQRNDRIGVIGPNGCGKTTLLRLLTGDLQPDTGSIEFGTNLHIAYFEQLRQTLDPEQTVWENLAPGGGDTVFVGGKPKHVISYLRDFLFTTDRAKSPVKQLSGGERQRLLLARIFTQPANLVVFDEPTNDLDTETLELLEEVLLNYSATALIVSHDREFLNNVVTSLFVFEEDGTVRDFVGGYDDWEQFRREQERTREPDKATSNRKGPQTPKSAPKAKKLTYREKQELESLPEKIESLEEEHRELNLQMGDPAFFQKAGFVAEARERIDIIDRELAEAYLRWEELENKPK